MFGMPQSFTLRGGGGGASVAKGNSEIGTGGIFLCLWLSGADFVVHVSAEVWLAVGVFEGEERTRIVRFL